MNASAMWRRLDTPGHDAAHVTGTSDGWRLEGIAVFAHDLGLLAFPIGWSADGTGTPGTAALGDGSATSLSTSK